MGVEPDQRIVDRLRIERIAWLCTLRPDGSPHVTPVWFVFRDTTWWICTQPGNRKVANVRADPRVSIALEGGVEPVVAEGRATVRVDGFPAEVAEGFMVKYGWDVDVPDPGRGGNVLLEVPVSRWLLAGRAR